ncbi:MAG TPA: hypothetical protein PKH24_07875 [Sedimentisphaerales bacterium]|nr:hypothetical protein [Sedimentisphaerales bacterium]HNU29318.1 hypothetical protein [Sedimentisphaerales bacterium]
MMKLNGTKGFTKVELLVVVLVAALIVAMVPPLSRRGRSDALHETCRANLAGIGKAILIYANDYEGKFPVSGGRSSHWGNVWKWDAPTRLQAFALAVDGSGGKAAISSCFYLLVKYAEVRPGLFVCPDDAGTTEFKLSELRTPPTGFKLIDAWDFGPESSNHCSYAYHHPFYGSALKATSDPGMAVAADRSRWFRSPSGPAGDFAAFRPDLPGLGGTPETARRGNSRSHKGDGQNVLFVDGHVSFEERSYCGLDHDNIYTVSDSTERGSPLGTKPTLGFTGPWNHRDSLLLSDPGVTKSAVTRQARDVDSRTLKQTAVVATLECPVPEHKNAIWCATFQIAWDKFRTEAIGEPIQITGAESLAARLDQCGFPRGDINETSYYANAGFVKDGIIEQIQKDMASRFRAEPVPTFGEKYRALPDVAMAYAYLNVDVGFQYPYYAHGGAFDFEDSNGIRAGSPRSMHRA